MRIPVLFVLIYLIPIFKVHAQIRGDGYNYVYYFYIDNLGTNIDSCGWTPNLKSDIFIETYYSKLDISDYKLECSIDYVKKTRTCFFTLKKLKTVIFS